LKEQLSNILEEARMVLPGVQALFGFQMIAVFNETFSHLAQHEKNLHMAAIALTAAAMGFALAPAAFHRRVEPDRVSEDLVNRCTQFLTWGMLPLALGITIDFYLVARISFGLQAVSAVFASLVLGFLLAMWFIWPGLLAGSGHKRE
jgi:hypothetical protein